MKLYRRNRSDREQKETGCGCLKNIRTPYLDFCQAAYLLKKVPRYDSVGEKLLTVEEKYYVTDHGFRQAVGFSNVTSIERLSLIHI